MIESTSRAKILLVDDDQMVLLALSRMLRRDFDVVTASNGFIGLDLLQSEGPFTVIVSDMRMPEMSGAAFLTSAYALAPDSVRILLTGQTDALSAVSCVNDAKVFRFLEKPCPPEILHSTLFAAVTHHRLLTAERVLLEETLTGCVGILTEMLAAARPVAFSRALRVRTTVRELAVALNVQDLWQIEVAALLSQLGALTLTESTLEKLNRGETLDVYDRKSVESLPRLACQIIGQIPRLDGVREILRYTNARYDGQDANAERTQGELLPMGARLLKVAMDIDTLESAGTPLDEIPTALRACRGSYDERILDELSAVLAMRAL